MSEKLAKYKCSIILVQIDEAHSDGWPVGIETILNVPQPAAHKTFEDRVDRANYFVSTYKPPYPVYVDGWDNVFANTFQAWPDKFYCVDSTQTVVSKSSYHKEGDNEAKIVVEYTDLLDSLIGE